MNALFATNWDEDLPVFTNIANLTDTLWIQSHQFEGKCRDLILKEMEYIYDVADEFNCGCLTAEETHECISEIIKYLNRAVSSYQEEQLEDNDAPSNVIQFPVHKVRLTPKMQAYQAYLNFEIVR